MGGNPTRLCFRVRGVLHTLYHGARAGVSSRVRPGVRVETEGIGVIKKAGGWGGRTETPQEAHTQARWEPQLGARPEGCTMLLLGTCHVPGSDLLIL